MTDTNTTLVWFRQDLRLTDNPALSEAIKVGNPILPVYIWDPESEGAWAAGGATRSWLYHSLKSLDTDLQKLGSHLVILTGDSLETLQKLVQENNTTHVFWNRRYEPDIIERDKQIKESLTHEGLTVKSFNASLLKEPWEIQNKSGLPFKVFTPFWKTHDAEPNPYPVYAKPKSIPSPSSWPKSTDLDDLKLLPKLGWDNGFYERFTPGEAAAHKELKGFASGIVDAYSDGRNRPDLRGTSRLSPHLHFGEISPRTIYNHIHALNETISKGSRVFLSEIGWREFAYHLIYHFPFTTDQPLREEFSQFPWEEDDRRLVAWQKGMTGVPMVDAGMRELYATGWMHNRVRMIVASFLVKNLMLPWQRGAEWFWDTLVDADLASNSLGWQWTAGCGADAAPYFRVFNPVLQGKKFDPDGEYVRRWIPELSKVPTKFIHDPWNAPPEILAYAGVIIGEHYPKKIVSLSESRARALQAYDTIKKTA